jgi:hypothetical protein
MTSKGRYLYQDAFSGHFRIPLELASGMVTIIAREGVLSMADLFSYLFPYPASVLCRTLIPNLKLPSVLRRTLIPNLNFLVSLLVLLIVTALFGQFKKIIPHYPTEGVSIQFHLQLNVRLDSHMVLQQLLFQPNWERRSKI